VDPETETVAFSAVGSDTGALGVLVAVHAAVSAATNNTETINKMLFLVLIILNSPLKVDFSFEFPVMLTGQG